MRNRKNRSISSTEIKSCREQVASFENEGNYPTKNIRYEKKIEKRRRLAMGNSFKK